MTEGIKYFRRLETLKEAMKSFETARKNDIFYIKGFQDGSGKDYSNLLKVLKGMYFDPIDEENMIPREKMQYLVRTYKTQLKDALRIIEDERILELSNMLIGTLNILQNAYFSFIILK